MSRWNQLVANTGLGGGIRTVLAVGFFTFLAVSASLGESSPFPVIAWMLGLGVPTLGRRWIVDRPELSAPMVNTFGLTLAGGAIAAGFARGILWAEGHPAEWPALMVLIGAVGAYLSAFFWLFSDPEIVRLDD